MLIILVAKTLTFIRYCNQRPSRSRHAVSIERHDVLRLVRWGYSFTNIDLTSMSCSLKYTTPFCSNPHFFNGLITSSDFIASCKHDATIA